MSVINLMLSGFTKRRIANLTGSGSIAIPRNVTEILAVGQGGTGASVWVPYQPPQPAVEPQPIYTGGYLTWICTNEYRAAQSTPPFPTPPSSSPAYDGQIVYSGTWYFGGNTEDGVFQAVLTGQTVSGYTAGSPATPAVEAHYEYTTGPSTTLSFQSKSLTWNGNNGAGYPGSSTKKIANLSGASGVLNYNIAPGTSLSFIYS